MNDYIELRDALRREKAMWLQVDGYLPPWNVLIGAMIVLPILMIFV